MRNWLTQSPMFQAVYLDIRQAMDKGDEEAAFDAAQSIVDRYRKVECEALQKEAQR